MKEINIMAAAALAFFVIPSCGNMEGPYESNSRYDSHSSHGYHRTPRVTALSNGHYSVSMGGGKVATLNKYGGIISQANMTRSEQLEAGSAVRTYRREQDGSDHHSRHGGHSSSSGVPVTRARSDGKIEVQMPSGGVVLYDRHGHMIQKGSTVSSSDLYRANRAVQSHLREQ